MFSTFGEKSAVGEKEVLTKKYVVVRERDLESLVLVILTI